MEEQRIHSDQLRLSRQTLDPSQIDGFLSYMFQDLSLRPKRLKLKETAAIVRYLKAIAVEAEFSPERALVEDISEVLWGTLLNTARIEIAAKTQAIEFVKEHSATYLVSFDVEAIVNYLRRMDVPTRHEESFRPPKLMGRSRSASHHGPARLGAC